MIKVVKQICVNNKKMEVGFMKRLVSLLLVLVLLGGLSGCATSNQTKEVTGKGEESVVSTEETNDNQGAVTDALKPRKITDRTLKIAMIPVTMNTAYTMTINGAKAEIENLGADIDMIVQAPSSNASTITEQGNLLESFIQQGVDAIALATESDASMLPYLRAAAEADIPVFLFNMTEIDQENVYYVSSIGYDQYNAGFEIGSWVAENYSDKETKIAVLEGYSGIVNTQRMDGFKKAIENQPSIEIAASQTADWTREKGQSVTESILTSNTDIDILYGPYDEMVLGGLVAIKERNMLDQIAVVGFGCTQDGITSIESGEMTATIDVGEYGTGYDIIDAIYAFCVEGKDVDKVINRTSKVYDSSNIGELDRTIFE